MRRLPYFEGLKISVSVVRFRPWALFSPGQHIRREKWHRVARGAARSMQSRAPWMAVLVAAMWCGGGGTSAPPPPGTIPAGSGQDILFIGNSLTLANDLSGMLQGLTAAVGVPLRTAQVAFGGYSLENRLARGDAARAIAEEGGGWSSCSKALPDSRTAACSCDGIRPRSTGSSAARARRPRSSRSGPTRRSVHLRRDPGIEFAAAADVMVSISR